jgi:acetoacetyl-CoA reductase
MALKHAGHAVVANFVGNEEAARCFMRETRIKAIKFDVADFDACAAGIEQVERELGAIDILVNNADITRDAMLHRMTVGRWHDVIATDLTSCFNMCHAVIGSMREHGFGRIVNISSINGQKGQVGQTNYAAAKSGVLGFTKALALESAAKGITVNAVAPGYTETDMVSAVPKEMLARIVEQIPAGRLGHAEDIAAIVRFLVSDEATFITGSTLSVNGGQLMA